MCKPSVVAYYRVSTSRQGRSGLGLEAQQAAVASYLASLSPAPKLRGEYVEVESGKHSDRPELLKAIEHAKLTGSTLIIAKLCRLARNVAFVSNLMESGVEFIAVDNPHANRLTLHILVAMAEHEAKLISERTKAALQAARSRGVVLGSPTKGAHLRGLGNGAAVAKVRRGADERAKALRPTLEALEARGVRHAGAVARELNGMGIETARGGRWTAQSVINLRERLLSMPRD